MSFVSLVTAVVFVSSIFGRLRETEPTARYKINHLSNEKVKG